MTAAHDLTGIAIVALAALACGIFMERLRQPALVGYILAGVLLGPSAFGLVANRDSVALLAELGVVMLLFVIGMELSLRGFRRVWALAVLVMALQVAGAVGAMFLFADIFGWSPAMAVLLGFIVALSSTAVAIKLLENVGELRTRIGQIVIGVLIAQDLAVVPMMLIVKNMAGDGIGVDGLLQVGISVAFLVLLILYLSRRHRLRLPFTQVVAGHMDLTPLAGLAVCFAGASLSGLFGLSPAYGAFLAGLIIGNSTERAAMLHSILPIQSVLVMVFFLSIGLLIDLGFLWDRAVEVMLLLLAVSAFKTALNVCVLRVLGQSWPHAFLSGALLGQIGEFSFIVVASGLSAGLIGENDYRLVVTVTALSLAISPFWLATARRVQGIILLSVTSGRETVRLLYGIEFRRTLWWLRDSCRWLATGAARLVGRRAAPRTDVSVAGVDNTGIEILPPERPPTAGEESTDARS